MEAINSILVGYVLNSLWQVTLIVGLALLCSLYLRRMPARHRHELWVLCLGACVLVPAVTVAWQIRANDSSANSVRVSGNESTPSSLPQGGGWSFLNLRSRTRPVQFASSLLNGLAFGYLGLLAFRCLQLGWIYRRTLQIRRRAYVREIPQGLSRAADRCQTLFGMGSISLLCSAEVSSPSTVGGRHPVLLIPPRFFTGQIADEDLMSALSHELAHIQRRDFLLNLIYQIASVPVCFHPAVALVKSRVAETRELACDEAAASVLRSGSQYARSLVQIAQNILAGAPPAKSNYALGLFDTKVLEERIMNILRMPESATKRSRSRMLFVCSLVAVLSLVTSAFSFRVSGDTSSADTQRFVGTWVTKYKGQAFITLKIKSANGALGGSVVHVDRLAMLADGELVPSSEQFVEQEIVEAKVAGNKLNLRIGGHDSIYFEFTLMAPNAGEMLTVGDLGGSPDQAPPQKKPWHFERVGQGQ